MALKKLLGGFTGTPVGRKGRKFAYDKPFDIGLGRFVIVRIRTHIADVRIREADNLPGIAGIGENFLVTGEAGIENDFAAATSASTRGTTVKYSSILKRESRATCGVLRQCVLQKNSFRCGVHC